MSTRRDYPTDLTEAQWALLLPLFPPRKWRPGGPGRPPCDLRRVFNGILYLLKTGCQWRMLPPDFGKWNTIYTYFSRWRRTGVWARLMAALRRLERQRQGRPPEPSAGSIDSQSIRTATQGTAVGFDGTKKIKGRKRHVLVDTLGLILAVVVTSASADDRVGLMILVENYWATGLKRLRRLWVDGGYRAEWLRQWVWSIKQTHKIALTVVDRRGPGFQVLPRRWTVERTFAWLLNYRRHSRDYEVRTENSEALIQVSMIHLLLKRLA
jgi:putative transposase